MNPAAVGRQMSEINMAGRFCNTIADTFMIGIKPVPVIVVVFAVVPENNRVMVELVVNTPVSWVIVTIGMFIFL